MNPIIRYTGNSNKFEIVNPTQKAYKFEILGNLKGVLFLLTSGNLEGFSQETVGIHQGERLSVKTPYGTEVLDLRF